MADDAQRQYMLDRAAEEDWRAVLTVAEAVANDFPDDWHVHLYGAWAHAKTGQLEAGVQWAELGLALTTQVPLMSVLFYSLLKLGRFAQVVSRWEDEFAGEVEPTHHAADHVYSHLIIAYIGVDRAQDALDGLVPLIERAPNPEPNLMFNTACLCSLMNAPSRALPFVLAARRGGYSAQQFADESDFDALRNDAIFRHLMGPRGTDRPVEGVFLRRGDHGVELSLMGTRLVERAFRGDSPAAPRETDLDGVAPALIAYFDRRRALESEGLVESEHPGEAATRDLIVAYLEGLVREQRQGGLSRDVGAIILEWDYGETPGIVQLQLLAETWSDLDAARARYRTYQGTDDDTLREDFFAEGLRLPSPESWARVVAEVADSVAFEALGKTPAVFFSQQEHDSGVEFSTEVPAQ